MLIKRSTLIKILSDSIFLCCSQKYVHTHVYIHFIKKLLERERDGCRWESYVWSILRAWSGNYFKKKNWSFGQSLIHRFDYYKLRSVYLQHIMYIYIYIWLRHVIVRTCWPEMDSERAKFGPVFGTLYRMHLALDTSSAFHEVGHFSRGEEVAFYAPQKNNKFFSWKLFREWVVRWKKLLQNILILIHIFEEWVESAHILI